MANEEFDGAMSLLDKAKDEGIQLDVQLFNTILREAYAKVPTYLAILYLSSLFVLIKQMSLSKFI